MNFFETMKLLFQFGFRPIRGETHAERLESFYGYQATRYDAYRERFLIGRQEIVDRLPFTAGARWLDVGCGTAYLLRCAGERARQCQRIHLVDLTPSLLELAQRRVDEGKWTNVEINQADATTLHLDQPVDIVTFSYSLSMIPNWFAALDRAFDLLKPGGTIGVADFFVSRKHTCDPVRHSWITRHFWPAWFDIDNVAPCSDHLPFLQYKFDQRWLAQKRTHVVGMPFFRPPCYQFIGVRKNQAPAPQGDQS